MKRVVLVFLLLTAGTLASSCNFFSQPVDLQTENLQNEQAQTQIAAVRATATVNADRMMITLENAQTAVGNIDLQSTRIASTLIASGMTSVDASGITPLAPTQDAAAADSSIPQIANPLLTPGAPLVSGQGSARGDSQLIPVTPTDIPVQATLDPNGPHLTDITLTDRVGADDCPVTSLTSVSSSATELYVTAVAHKIAANSTLTANFSHDGQAVQTYTWQPDFNIDGACIWFHMPASDVQFTPGNWTVTLTIDGATAGSLDFSITSDTPSQIDPNNTSG